MKIRDFKKEELKKEIISAHKNLKEETVNSIVDSIYSDNYEPYDVEITVTSNKDEVYKFLKGSKTSLDLNEYPHFELVECKTWNVNSPFDERGFIDRNFELNDDVYAIYTLVKQVNQIEDEYYHFLLIYDPNFNELDNTDYVHDSIKQLMSMELKDSEYKQDIIKFVSELSSLCDCNKAYELISEWYFIFR